MTAPRDCAEPATECYGVEDEEEAADDFDVLDEHGKPRVLADKCTTCVFRAGNLMQLRDDRLRDMIVGALIVGTWITCHKTLRYYPNNPGWRAICRGYYDGLRPQVADAAVADPALRRHQRSRPARPPLPTRTRPWRRLR